MTWVASPFGPPQKKPPPADTQAARARARPQRGRKRRDLLQRAAQAAQTLTPMHHDEPQRRPSRGALRRERRGVRPRLRLRHRSGTSTHHPTGAPNAHRCPRYRNRRMARPLLRTRKHNNNAVHGTRRVTAPPQSNIIATMRAWARRRARLRSESAYAWQSY